MANRKRLSKQDAYKKIEFYSREITSKRPQFDTVFRIYYDSLKLVSELLYHIDENPWHPDNDYGPEILESMDEKFESLEELRLKAIR